MFGLNSQDDKSAEKDALAPSWAGITFIRPDDDYYAELRGTLVEVFSQFNFLEFGVYRGLSRQAMDVFSPSAVRKSYSLGDEIRMCLEWVLDKPIQIPHNPGIILVPRECEYVNNFVKRHGLITIPSYVQVSEALMNNRAEIRKMQDSRYKIKNRVSKTITKEAGANKPSLKR